MQIDTALLRFTPMLRHAVIGIRLVYQLGDELGPVVDEGGIGRGDLGAMDGVGGGIFDKEGEQGEDGAYEEEDDY